MRRVALPYGIGTGAAYGVAAGAGYSLVLAGALALPGLFDGQSPGVGGTVAWFLHVLVYALVVASVVGAVLGAVVGAGTTIAARRGIRPLPMVGAAGAAAAWTALSLVAVAAGDTTSVLGGSAGEALAVLAALYVGPVLAGSVASCAHGRLLARFTRQSPVRTS